MIPSSHLVVLALLQFVIGLLGLLLRRGGMVILVSILLMQSGVWILFTSPGINATSQAAGVTVLVLLVSLGLTGAGVLYAFNRFRRTVDVDEQERMKH